MNDRQRQINKAHLELYGSGELKHKNVVDRHTKASEMVPFTSSCDFGLEVENLKPKHVLSWRWTNL